jgi:Protein of unknown function (DUF3993)
MKKYLLTCMIGIITISFIFPSLSRAASTLSDDNSVFQFLQEAFQAQVSLGEQLQYMEDINKLMIPYFTDDYMSVFLEENLVAENGKYITYGTDFPIYYIPFFSYTEETKIIWSEDHIYAFEFFSETNEGPVSYDSHYEGVRLDRAAGDWKVAKYLYDDIPSEIIEQSKNEAIPAKENISQKSIIKATLQIGWALNPIASFCKVGNSFAADYFK